jgi:hypothetical protein
LNPDPKNLKPINICAFTVKIALMLHIIPGSATGCDHSLPFKEQFHLSTRFNGDVCGLVYIEKSNPNPNFNHSTHFQILTSTQNHGWTKTQHATKRMPQI